MPDKNILHETKNLYLYDNKGELEIRLNGHTHAVLVGKSPSIEKAKQTMDRLEKYPIQLRAFMQHPAN